MTSVDAVRVVHALFAASSLDVCGDDIDDIQFQIIYAFITFYVFDMYVTLIG